MAITIASASPPRGRAGDTVVLTGTGFDTVTPSDNIVRVDGVLATVSASTSTTLTFTVPAITTEDGWTAIVVMDEDDTVGAGAAIAWWCKASLATVRTGEIPGQVPGPGESPHVEQSDKFEAKDYERATEFLYFLIRRLVSAKGDIYARNSSNIARFGCGVGGQALEAQPAADEGFGWSTPPRQFAIPFGSLVQSANTAATDLSANGNGNNANVGNYGEVCSPVRGIVDALWVLVEEEASTDTLAQVIFLVNGVAAYTSAAALGLTQGKSHRVTGLTIDVAAGDTIQLRCQKSGAAAAMKLHGGVRIIELRAEVGDAIAIEDDVEAELL